MFLLFLTVCEKCQNFCPFAEYKNGIFLTVLSAIIAEQKKAKLEHTMTWAVGFTVSAKSAPFCPRVYEAPSGTK